MALIGVLTGIGLWLLGIPLPAILGVITATLTFIPNIGPILSLVPALLLGLLQGPMTAVYVVLLYLGVPVVETYIVTPVVQKKMVLLPPVVTLIAQLLAGSVLGGLGLMLAAPLAADGSCSITRLCRTRRQDNTCRKALR